MIFYLFAGKKLVDNTRVRLNRSVARLDGLNFPFMNSKFNFLVGILLISLSAFCQKISIPDSLKCKQYFDTLANRQLYNLTEKDVEYKGGAEGFSNYINRNFIYDRSEIEHQTALFFTFIVEPDGSVTNVSLIHPDHGVTNAIIEKAISVLKRMPKLIPAECNNKKVPVRKIQPIILYPDRNY